jgi:hypothetical protein
VAAERIERVWDASAPLDPAVRVSAVGRFGQGGLAIEFDNGLGQALESPLVVWDRRAMSLGDVAAGKSTVASMQPNATGDFTNAAVLTSDLAKRRGQIVKASLNPPGESAATARNESSPMIVGWLAGQADDALVAPAQRKVDDAKAMVMVRSPLRIEPSAVGSTVSIPPALVSFDPGRLPYDARLARSEPSQQDGEWLIGFAAPPQVGLTKPARRTLQVRVTLPAFNMRVRRGQCAGAKPAVAPAGPVVAEWGGEVGQRQVTIDCQPGDYDAQGRVWLLLEVQSREATKSAGVSWQVRDVSAAIEAEVVGPPPAPIALDPPPPPRPQQPQSPQRPAQEQ